MYQRVYYMGVMTSHTNNKCYVYAIVCAWDRCSVHNLIDLAGGPSALPQQVKRFRRDYGHHGNP